MTKLKVPTPLVSERPQKSEAVSSWGDILIYPKQIPHKKTRAGTSGFPTHISSDQMIKYLKEKEDKKIAEEEAKRKRKEDRELKKQQRQAQKEQITKGRKSQRKTQRKVVATTRIESDDDDDILCPACSSGSDLPDGWVCCDVCDTWFHKVCTDIPRDQYDDLSETDWYCSVCM